jgi:hypothetical protein
MVAPEAAAAVAAAVGGAAAAAVVEGIFYALLAQARSGEYKKEKANDTRFLVCSAASQGRSSCGVAALWCTTCMYARWIAGFGHFSPTYRVRINMRTFGLRALPVRNRDAFIRHKQASP